MFRFLMPLAGIGIAIVAGAEFTHMKVDTQSDRPVKPYIKLLGDLSGDGCVDILVASAKSNGIVWYESPNWIRHVIRSDGAFSEQGQLADVDRDGDIDAILPGRTGIHWYENPISGNEIGDPRTDRWNAHLIGSDGTNVHDLAVADLDKDGLLDIAARYEKETRKPLTVWFQQPPDHWKAVEVSDHYGEGLDVGDIDGDGWQDLVINELWLRNGDNGSRWEAARYTEGMPDQLKVVCGDIDRDGRDEIVVSPQSRVPQETRAVIACFFLIPAEQQTRWSMQVLAEGPEQVNKVHGLAIGDMDRDGDLDITTSKRHDARGRIEICIYDNTDGKGRSWSRSVVAQAGSHNHVLGDIQCDGDLDILGANWNDEALIEVWLNDTTPAKARSETELLSP